MNLTPIPSLVWRTALASIRKDEPDLVLLDMIMPRMNGRDCFFALRKSDPEVRVVMASGFSRDEDIHELRAAGLRGFIHKPYRSAALSQVVAEAIKA